ncbi:MAG: outer membrane protein assembly factor BamD [Syntrophobacterales bacterium]|nr:outer membrane protein assembly factor BamD [Syntrophobacterales bacterium]
MVHDKKVFAALLIAVFLLAGCKMWLPWQSRTGMPRANPESIYQQGLEEYNAGSYKRSIELFQRVKEEYPLSPLAIMAEMGVADSFFSSKEYPEAALAYKEFVDLHPTNENLPYAMYQTGMCYLNQLTTIDRDNSEAFKAIKEFERLTARFPESKFSVLAGKKILECRKSMGEKELYIGEFYFKTKKYAASLRRLEKVARDYANIGLDDKKVNRLITEAKNHLNAPEKKKSWWLF